jgi:hypothetical protein
LNQHKDSIPEYGIIARPLYELTGNRDWQWGQKEDATFELLRRRALDNVVLAAPDFTKQVIVAREASDDGKGYVIYQLKDPKGEDVQANRNIIKYGSKAWSRSMQGKPPYYGEADALITGAVNAKYYANATHFPWKVIADQAPLKYIKTCSKGQVTTWRIEHLWDCEYEVKYRPGPWNKIADALSRYPMIGPEKLARVGLESAIAVLLKTLPQAVKSIPQLWVWAGKDTALTARTVQAWRTPSNVILKCAPKVQIQEREICQ